MLIKARLGEKLFQDQIDAAIVSPGMDKLKLNRTKENYAELKSLIGLKSVYMGKMSEVTE